VDAGALSSSAFEELVSFVATENRCVVSTSDSDICVVFPVISMLLFRAVVLTFFGILLHLFLPQHLMIASKDLALPLIPGLINPTRYYKRKNFNICSL